MDNHSSLTLYEDCAPRTEQAALYALGALSQTEACVMERRLECDATLTSDCHAFGQVVGLLGLSAPERTPASIIRRRLLDGIAVTDGLKPASRATQIDQTAQPVKKTAPEFPALINEHGETDFSLRANEGSWRHCAPGVLIKTLYLDHSRGKMTTLVQVAPGGQLPRHRHLAAEESFILAGSCSINGDTFSVGDYRRAPQGTIDGEVTTTDGVTFLMISSPRIEMLA